MMSLTIFLIYVLDPKDIWPAPAPSKMKNRTPAPSISFKGEKANVTTEFAPILTRPDNIQHKTATFLQPQQVRYPDKCNTIPEEIKR